MRKEVKVAFIHGRPGPHIMHGRFAESVGGVSHFVDEILPYHEKQNHSRIKYLSWVMNAIFFPKAKKYDVFLVEGPHFPPLLMRLLGKISKKQKLVCHLGSETLYFLYSNYYPERVKNITVRLLEQYDALMCEGKMAADLSQRLLQGKGPKIYATLNGIPAERVNTLMRLNPALDGENIIFISSGPSGWRTWYKGLDMMIEAFHKARQTKPNLQFYIVGKWHEEEKERLLAVCDAESRKGVHFVGETNDIEKYLAMGSLYLHCSRGDAFPTAVMEAMAAGLVPIVSEWTGTKEVVEQADPQLVIPLDMQLTAEKILWYFNLPPEEKKRLSDKGRQVVANYTEDKAIEYYRKTFNRMLEDIGVV
jgi:glycosyltransferase involved in cell wall biosynthesis